MNGYMLVKMVKVLSSLSKLCSYVFTSRRRARRLQLLSALGLSIVFFVCVAINLVIALRILMGSHNVHDQTLYPEYSNDLQVSEAANMAYRFDWVGLPDLKNVSCQSMITKSKTKLSRYDKRITKQIPDTEFVTADCPTFRRKYGYGRYMTASQDEMNFPLAFIILFHKDFHQIHLLLRAIYLPHNVYCLTPDSKAEASLIAAARSTAACLTNVFVPNHLESITYAGFSRLKADLRCMSDLSQHRVRWKYVINMPGQQFPLRTNLELVRILHRFNGANDVEGITGLGTLLTRYKKKHRLVRNTETGEMEMVSTTIDHPAPPHGLKVIKGSAYNTVSRAFVHFVLTDGRVKDLLRWTKDVLSPDEYFWAMLNHNPSLRAPGGYPGIPGNKPALTVFAIWQNENHCTTMFVREICIMSTGDLPLLMTRSELFANKFYLQHYPMALHCLDQMIFNRSITGHVGNMAAYDNLKFALPPPE